jgi:hypothetical protein
MTRPGNRIDENELHEPVRLCDSQGRLRSEAIGWSRRPLVTCNLRGAWPRKKRWDYWCVTSPTHLIALTYADIDYLGIADLFFLCFESGRTHRHSVAVPLALGFRQAPIVDAARIDFDAFGLRLSMHDEAGGTRLAFRSRRRSKALEGEIVVALPEAHETLNVVVPWSEARFQFTSKHQARPARGELRLGGESHAFGEDAFGCLDFGRGVWPYETTWNWASASGRQDAGTLGLNLGGQWTDGTGSTENGVVLDGRLSKIAEDVRFDYDARDFMRPWTIRSSSGAVDLAFTPFHERVERIQLGVASSAVHQCFGHFDGAVGHAGERVEVRHLLGWAEEHRARW